MVTTTLTPLGAGGSALEPVCPQTYTLVSFVSFLINPMTRLLSNRSHPALARSLEDNRIGDKGVTALAAILNKTKITNLKCAAAPECSLSCQRPLTC